MPDPKNDNAPPPVNAELEEVALRIFCESAALGRGGEQMALAAFKAAEAWAAVKAKVRAGLLKPASREVQILANCSSPNLDRTHPYNLISQRFGSKDTLALVVRVKKWLDANPPPEKAAEDDVADYVSRFDDAFGSEVKWKGKTPGDTLAVINTARAIFPTYCKN